MDLRAALQGRGRMQLHAEALRADGYGAFDHVAEIDDRLDPAGDDIRARSRLRP